jgi:hypothetical protein
MSGGLGSGGIPAQAVHFTCTVSNYHHFSNSFSSNNSNRNGVITWNGGLYYKDSAIFNCKALDHYIAIYNSHLFTNILDRPRYIHNIYAKLLNTANPDQTLTSITNGIPDLNIADIWKNAMRLKIAAYNGFKTALLNQSMATISLLISKNDNIIYKKLYDDTLINLNTYINTINLNIILSDSIQTTVSEKQLSNDSFLQNITEILDMRPEIPNKDAMMCEPGKEESKIDPTKCIFSPGVAPSGYTYDSSSDVFSEVCSNFKDSNNNSYVDIDFMYCAEDCTKKPGNYVEKVPYDNANLNGIVVKDKNKCWEDCTETSGMRISQYNNERCRTAPLNGSQEERWALFSWMKDYASGFEQFFGVNNIIETYGDAGGAWWVPGYLPTINITLPDIPLIMTKYNFPYKYGDGPAPTYNVLNTDINRTTQSQTMGKIYAGSALPLDLTGRPTQSSNSSIKIYDRGRSHLNRLSRQRDMILRTDLSRYNTTLTNSLGNINQTVFNKIQNTSANACPVNNTRIKYDSTNLNAGCIPVLNNTFMTVRTEGLMSEILSVKNALSTLVAAERGLKEAVEATFPSSMSVAEKQKKWGDWLTALTNRESAFNSAIKLTSSVSSALQHVSTAKGNLYTARRTAII